MNSGLKGGELAMHMLGMVGTRFLSFIIMVPLAMTAVFGSASGPKTA